MCATNTGQVYVDDCNEIGNKLPGCPGKELVSIVTNDPEAYWGLHEPSNFSIMEIVSWDRTLKPHEIKAAMGYLNYVVDPQDETLSECHANYVEPEWVSCDGPNPWTVPQAGIVAWFQHENISDDSWPSSVGSFAAIYSGNDPEIFSNCSLQYLSGSLRTYISWGAITPADAFTICTVTKYPEQAERQGRVLTASGKCNWLHGQWDGLNGMSYQGDVAGFVTQNLQGTTSRPWTVLCATNTGVVYVDDCNSVGSGATGCAGPELAEIITNSQEAYWGINDASSFSIMEIITWNRILSLDELQVTMGYLNHLVDPSNPVDRCNATYLKDYQITDTFHAHASGDFNLTALLSAFS